MGKTSKERSPRLVADTQEAIENVRRFDSELRRSTELVDIMSYGRAWYAVRDGEGWLLGPSKFIGYADNAADSYLAMHDGADGRLTERILSRWFEAVEPGSALFDELHAALRAMFARHGKSPNQALRIMALKTDLSVGPLEPREKSTPNRITTNPNVCGGRPCIRGMRIRVSDVLDLLAAGNDRSTILADYPYLDDADISAVLDYASQAVDHRVIKAA